MRFTISRTSNPYFVNAERPPCPGATIGPIDSYTHFTFRSVAEAKKRYPDREFEKTKHGVRSGPYPAQAWFIEVETLDDLLALYRKQGRLIVEPNDDNGEFVNIEIYDDYRE